MTRQQAVAACMACRVLGGGGAHVFRLGRRHGRLARLHFVCETAAPGRPFPTSQHAQPGQHGTQLCDARRMSSSEPLGLEPLRNLLPVAPLDLHTAILEPHALRLHLELRDDRLTQRLEVSKHFADDRQLPRVVVTFRPTRCISLTLRIGRLPSQTRDTLSASSSSTRCWFQDHGLTAGKSSWTLTDFAIHREVPIRRTHHRPARATRRVQERCSR